jgi:hypothetical protein
MTPFYLLIVGVEGYCCTRSNSVTHTHKFGRTPLGEGSARRRDLYLSAPNTNKGQTSMSPAGFEPTAPTSDRPQIHALDRAVTGICILHIFKYNNADGLKYSE